MDVFLVLSWIPGEDEDVIEVDKDIDVEDVTEDVVHEVLEGGWSIGEAKGHDEAFEVTIACPEGCFPFIARFDTEKVVGTTEVEFGEDFGATETVEGFRDERKGIAVLDGDAVEATVVDTETERTILLFDE